MIGNIKNVNYKKLVNKVHVESKDQTIILGEPIDVNFLLSQLEIIKGEFTHLEIVEEEDNWGDFSHYSLHPFKYVEESDEDYESRITKLEIEELKKEEKRQIEEETKKAARKQSEENLLRKLALELGYEITLKNGNPQT